MTDKLILHDVADRQVGRTENGGVVKAWTRGVPFEEQAREQVARIADMPFIHKHVAVMPDVHWGMGATVGSVIATKGAIIPAAVGVDIGCGMMALHTTLRADQLPDNLSAIRSDIERAVPHGFQTVQGRSVKGNWLIPPNSAVLRWKGLFERYMNIVDAYPAVEHKSPLNQMGTLGGGNHFIELCLDENNEAWVMLHSGSRGAGNAIGRTFIDLAKKEMRRHYINLPDQDLAYISEGSDLFDDYMDAVEWAQDYAAENRKQMMEGVLRTLRAHLPGFTLSKLAVNCHHNYISREYHFGANVFVTRKGAVRAREGDLGIIPGSMGAKSFIVRGLGNASSFHSCSHGAGRVMSRTQAKKEITLSDHIEATAGIECRKDEEVIDESPRAYKNVDDVMAAQSSLVEIVHTLRQVLCVKG